MSKPLFRKLDNLLLRVSDLDAAISFYRDKLGHPLLWRDRNAAGFALLETDAELVVHLEIGPESDLLVDDTAAAVARFVAAGGEIIEAPFDIAIGLCARVRDPFGNVLVILDQSKGKLATAADGSVVGTEPLDK
jgi:catechol 2,3-dioxygenase-like lactoylglutathione lyase family enzyme